MILQRPNDGNLYYGGAECQSPVQQASKWYLAGGVVAPVKAVYVPYGAASLAAGKLNVDAPGTDDLTGGVNPSFDPLTGFSFNGSSQYLICGSISMRSTYTILLRLSNLVAATGRRLFGTNSGGCTYGAYTLSTKLYVTVGASTLTCGVHAGLTSIGLSGLYVYKNGNDVYGPGSNYTCTHVTYVGCFNNNDGPANYACFNMLWMAIYAGALTGAQVTAVLAAAPI